MIYDSAREPAFNHDAIVRLHKKIANEDVRERPLHQTQRYYHSTRHLMQPAPPILMNEASARQPSPYELAERAAIILALNVTSSKKPNQSQLSQ